jgi:hypothetical protein
VIGGGGAPRPLPIALAVIVATLGVAAVAAIASLAGAAHRHHHHTGWPHGRCFPARYWNAPDRYRPCARIVSVEEDGSVTIAADDHDGVERWRYSVGALDR